ncbi:hypothetical protein [Aquimarina algiphila]|uniref:Uncharacterized protein n=1 Tax=Aquimarina algiphila TaxID=2047982 RepID=A0A554VJ28_9FLAO|nr:hypothetical protein [Aquimarina algiphila]TSE07901.1 hypothetical protein FOF46_14340 [Aquimarina algiphila]
MEYLKLAGIFIGASAFWKALEALLHFGLQKKLKKAELRNLNAETNEKVIGNWIAWSDKMEERIQGLEKNNKEMKQTITKQRERINDLEVYIEELEHKLKKYQEKK